MVEINKKNYVYFFNNYKNSIIILFNQSIRYFLKFFFHINQKIEIILKFLVHIEIVDIFNKCININSR